MVQAHSLIEPTYKLTQYDHVKSFIEQQTKEGNTIKFARDNNSFCVGYDAKGRNFFVYDIQRHAITRRFRPAGDFESLLDDKINEGLEEYVENINVRYKMGKQVTTLMSGDENPEEPFFEVAPNGSYMLFAISGQLYFKQLLINPYLRDLVEPGYFADECQQA
jgi:hypothetical protein